MKRSKRWIWIAVGLGILAVAVAFFVRASSPPIPHSPGTMIRYDDFDFTAISAEEVEAGLYEVEVRIENHAKVVDFEFKPEVVRVSDEDGNDFQPASQTTGATLGPGESTIRAMRFQGPAGLKMLWVRFEFAGGFFNMIDRATLGNRQIKLTVRSN
jgi:hypothetical protein